MSTPFNFAGKTYDANLVATLASTAGIPIPLRKEQLVISEPLVVAKLKKPAVVMHEGKYCVMATPTDFEFKNTTDVLLISTHALKKIKLS